MADQFNFSRSLKRLEEIVRKMEDPNLDLDEGLGLLEEGVKLQKACLEKLNQAQAKIKQILKTDSETVPSSSSDEQVTVPTR
jgi:exodeoxyribonuclease VII small subunit